MMVIAVDLMGSDFSYEVLLEGVIKFLESNNQNVKFILVGTKAATMSPKALSLKENYPDILDFKTVDHYIKMSDDPTEFAQNYDNYSVAVCAELVAKKEADLLFSAGNTGATVLESIRKIGFENGNSIAPILCLLPGRNQNLIAMTDAGSFANREVRAEDLVDFAVLGNDFLLEKFNQKSLRIGLLNVGTEVCKGKIAHREANRLLAAEFPNFVGNVEPDIFFKDQCDLVVTDGFTGNIVLKLLEEMKKDQKNSYESVGAAFLLGLKGKVAIAHGKSNFLAIANGLKICLKYYN